MFKIDWATAIGGAVVGYLAKGKVEDTKAKFRKISTDALSAFKESCGDENPFRKAFQNTQSNGGNNGN